MRVAYIVSGLAGMACAVLLMLPSTASAGRFPVAPLLALTQTAEPPTPLPDTPVPDTPVPPTLVPSTPTAVPETPVPSTATPTRRRGGDAQDEPTATPTAEPTMTPEPTATDVPVSPTADPTATPAVVARTRPSRLPPTGASDELGIAWLLAWALGSLALGSLALGLRAPRTRR